MLELVNISFSFEGEKNLLENISVHLAKGRIYALMGTNGSGKTTLFNIITGYLKPRSGSIRFKGNDVTKMPSFEMDLMGINRTFQDLRCVTKLSVKENILLAMKNNPTDKWFNSLLPGYLFNSGKYYRDTLADNLLDNYFLKDVKDSLAGEISFGQQKLLNLACCAANEADLLLLDEPIAGINPEYMKLIAELLLKLKEKGKTIFFIEHNTEFISGITDHVFFLDQGRLREYETITEMSSDGYVKEAYL